MKRILILFLFCSQAFGITSIVNSFNAGELSPLLQGRTDVDKYYSGVRTLENFLVLSYGGVERRPGSKFIATVKNQQNKTRLLPFEFSVTQTYIIEAGNTYFRFYKDGGQILDPDDPVEVSTPYLTADLFELQFIQSADTMYIAHPEYATRTLTRASDTSWTLAVVDFQRGPFLTDNDTAITITPSAVTGSVTLTATDDVWNANHVGALWEVTHTVDSEQVDIALTTGAEQNSSSVTVQLGRKVDWSTHGTWTGTVILQRSFDSGSTWKDVRPVHYADDGNTTFPHTETVDDAVYRIHKTASAITSGTCNSTLIARSFDVEGVASIASFTDPCIVTATVQNTIGSTDATTVWAEGAWSADEGYPSTLTFFQERLVLAATTNSPQSIWLSQTDDWPNFLAGDKDADAMSFTIAADQVNVIRWLAPQADLLIGTVSAEWKLTPSESSKAVTPTNFTVSRQSSYGSAYIQPAMSNNVVLYVQRQGRKIRELAFSFTEDAWVSPDLTILSEHITESGIVEVSLQKTPDPILWCIKNDGELACMTYERDQNVVGWHKQVFDGDVETVAIIPGEGEDEVWVIVERDVGGPKRYIEQLQPRDWTDQEDGFYVDSGLSFDGGDAVTITSISMADPGVVTAMAHGFSDGDQIRIDDVLGMTSLNGEVFSVGTATDDAFELRDATDSVDWDTTGANAYISDGTVLQVENTFTNLSHLNTETVAIVGDGGFVGTEQVVSNTVSTDDFFNTVHVGLSYDSKLQSMRLELPSTSTLQGRTKRIHELTLRFVDTLGCRVGLSFDETDPIVFRDADDPLEEVTPLFSGDKLVEVDFDYETDGSIFVIQSDPLPITLTALIPRWEAYE